MMKNGIKITIEVLLIVMTPAIWQNGVGVIIKCYRGETFEKVQYESPTIKHKE